MDALSMFSMTAASSWHHYATVIVNSSAYYKCLKARRLISAPVLTDTEEGAE